MLFGCDCKKLFRYIVILTVFILYAFTLYFPDYRGRSVKQVIGWELNVTRDVGVYIIPENITSIINGKELCQDDRINTVIIVFSAPENVAQRYAIRQTWALHNLTNVTVGFLLGWTFNASMQIQIEAESKEFHDIVQENFIDSYNNLTIKSVMMLKWYLHYCPSPVYLMKTDDDMYVNVTNLSNLLGSVKKSVLLIGSLICRAKPILDSNNKWYCPKYMYKEAFYPDYLSGTGYVMSRKVAIQLFDAVLKTPIIHIEDIYLTGICAAKAGIKPRNHGGFTYENLGYKCIPNMITNHGLNPQELHIAWANRLNCSFATRRTSDGKLMIVLLIVLSFFFLGFVES